MISVSKESLNSPLRLALSRDDVIYISNDIALDINDTSHKAFNKSLPSIQAITQSLEDTKKIGNIGKSPIIHSRLAIATTNRIV